MLIQWFPQKAIYKWYISGIYCQLGDYMLPFTFYGNQKQPLIDVKASWCFCFKQLQFCAKVRASTMKIRCIENGWLFFDRFDLISPSQWLKDLWRVLKSSQEREGFLLLMEEILHQLVGCWSEWTANLLESICEVPFPQHTLDGSEIRRSPVEVGSLSHYLPGFSTIPGGCLGFPPTVSLLNVVTRGDRVPVPTNSCSIRIGNTPFVFLRDIIWNSIPIGSMYGIFTCIWLIFMVNV